MRELAEDAGDDRIVEQLTAGGAPSSTTLVGRLSPLTRIREGNAFETAIDQRSLHFFDPQTSLAIYD